MLNRLFGGGGGWGATKLQACLYCYCVDNSAAVHLHLPQTHAAVHVYVETL